MKAHFERNTSSPRIGEAQRSQRWEVFFPQQHLFSPPTYSIGTDHRRQTQSRKGATEKSETEFCWQDELGHSQNFPLAWTRPDQVIPLGRQEITS